ncbi:uncharacterized protein [Rutidosis leptorrhynchoides]|uniref:uncharacterized protein n=1 Tax=Rutidosis leptorrhynchoides TaxID=125765 RepID=UPI003A99DFD0
MSEITYGWYRDLLDELAKTFSVDLWFSFSAFSTTIYHAEEQNKYSKPMPWIGMYIALASLFCILAMVADLLHGLKIKKLWFPCKYFTLNAASLTVIAVAMKLPTDLTTVMPRIVDQTVKLGSLSFMCTMMANLLPSLATMDNNELVTNIIALGILVITVVVNVCIEITTGALSTPESEIFLGIIFKNNTFIKIAAITYVVMLLMLLIIHTSSTLTIVKFKQLLESKYQTGHEKALGDVKTQESILTFEKIKQHVTKYWIMAGTGSPQFVTGCSATNSASGVICASSTFLHILIMIPTITNINYYESDYKWSTYVIFVTQSIGVLLGTISPVSRCFANLSFELSIKWIWSHIKVFNVENYWTEKLCDWKQSSIPFFARNRKIKIIIKKLKILILKFCVIFQKTVVVTCKTIALIPTLFVICVLYCKRCKKCLKEMFSDSDMVLGDAASQQGTNSDLSHFVLKYQDDMELTMTTFKKILNSMEVIIKKAEKQQPYNLMKLLERSNGFQGVESFDNHDVIGLLIEEPHNSWSLPVVTLTCIAISLPNIPKNRVNSLLQGVSEGLVYVRLVEKVLNGMDEYVCIQKAAEMLWIEVEDSHKWLGNNLQNLPRQVNMVGQILQWFKDTAKNVVDEVKSMDIESAKANSRQKSICANSMYRITEKMLLSYHTNIDQVREEELFEKLSSLVSDILAACLTNLPQVIITKCHESAIEKREASVTDVVKLLGTTEKIIIGLQERELPNLNLDEFPFIDKWCAKLMHTSP